MVSQTKNEIGLSKMRVPRPCRPKLKSDRAVIFPRVPFCVDSPETRRAFPQFAKGAGGDFDGETGQFN